ncbi:hypothetical protein BGZ46_003052 [Entomortierella lignicola]|nr:hypothetical protein BGZ46_003052 [Entomortierella lignicola]
MWQPGDEEIPLQSSNSSQQPRSVPKGHEDSNWGHPTLVEPSNLYPSIEVDPRPSQPTQISVEPDISQSSNTLSTGYPVDHFQGQHTADSQDPFLSSHLQYHNNPSDPISTDEPLVVSTSIVSSTLFSDHKLDDRDTETSTTELPETRRYTSSDPASLITRVSIPKSHHAQFVEVLSNPPDPSLKIKKSVRFNNTSFVPSKAESAPKSVRSYSASSSSKILHPPIADKDPEEKMAELMQLKQMKIRQDDFLHLKDEIFQTSQALEDKQSILDEVRSERKQLQSELARYVAMVKQIQKDFELTQKAEAELTNERDQLSQQLKQLKHHDYKIFKEEVDELRMKKGLRPLPSLEQEEAEFMGRYLEQRREHWREDGTQDELPNDGGVGSSTGGGNSNSNSNQRGAGTGPSPSSSSSNRASSSGSTTKSVRTSASNSSIASVSSSTAASSSRSGKSPSHSRSNSTSGKSRYESSIRNGSSGHSSTSRSGRQGNRSQSPPQTSTSTNARTERLKKRSRY